MKEIKWPMTERDMMECPEIWPENEEELIEFIRNLVKYENNDYGTAARSMTLAAEAAFNYIAHVFGVTGFQASCADLAFFKRQRNIESGFRILNYDDLLFPQYLDKFNISAEECIKENAKWLKEQATKNLANHDGFVSKAVLNHWAYLANLEVDDKDE